MKSSVANNSASALKMVTEQLIKDELVVNQKKIAKLLKVGEGALSLMVNGKRTISFKLLAGLFDKYNVNINFIMSGGKGDIYISELEGLILEEGESPYQFLAQHKVMTNEIAQLKKQLHDKEKIITLLEGNEPKK